MSKKNSWFSYEKSDKDALFVASNKFVEGGYACCGRRIYKVVRLAKKSDSAVVVPVLRFHGNVVAAPAGGFAFKHATRPKGRYPKDKEGGVKLDNYTPATRGEWWRGAVTIRQD